MISLSDVFQMLNSSVIGRTEICRSHITTSSTARILSSATVVGGRLLRRAPSKARVESLNSTTHFATVRYIEQSHGRRQPTL